MVYKWYILAIGGLYATYHLLGEPETAIDVSGTQIGQKTGSIFDNFLPLGLDGFDGGELSKMVSPKERRSVAWLHEQ